VGGTVCGLLPPPVGDGERGAGRGLSMGRKSSSDKGSSPVPRTKPLSKTIVIRNDVQP
jgi:hypothetical protein